MNTTEPENARTGARALARGGQERRNRRGLPFRVVTIVATSVLSTLLSAGISYSADGPTPHEVTWIHESPSEVTSFVIFVSAVEGSTAAARQINVGKPGGSSDADAGSAQFYSAFVPIGADEYVAVAAIGRNGLLGDLSVWSQPQPTQPGQPLVVQP